MASQAEEVPLCLLIGVQLQFPVSLEETVWHAQQLKCMKKLHFFVQIIS